MSHARYLLVELDQVSSNRCPLAGHSREFRFIAVAPPFLIRFPDAVYPNSQWGMNLIVGAYRAPIASVSNAVDFVMAI